MDLQPYMQSVPALAAFSIAIFAMLRAHERSIARIVAKHDKDRLDALVLRAEVASLRRLVLNSQPPAIAELDSRVPLPLAAKVV